MVPKLSVVIPCYNMGDFVQEAIASVLSYPNQNDIEVIVVNDGSNDKEYTKNILDGYPNSNIRIIHQENYGLGITRNNGIKAASAPYVLVLDADNKIRHEYITRGISILDQHPEVAIVYGDNRQFGMYNQDVIVGDFDISKLLQKNYIDACVVLRKKAWESVNGYDEKMPIMGYEDWDINMRLFFKGWQFKYVNEILYDYRVRENSMLVNSNNKKEVLYRYIFSKPELKQAGLLRNKITDSFKYREEYKNIQKRKMIRLALKLETPLKLFSKLFKK